MRASYFNELALSPAVAHNGAIASLLVRDPAARLGFAENAPSAAIKRIPCAGLDHRN